MVTRSKAGPLRTLAAEVTGKGYKADSCAASDCKDFTDALKAAQDVLAKDIRTKDEADSAMNALRTAEAGLIDISLLKQACDYADQLVKASYKEAGWGNIESTLPPYKQILASPESQSQVNNAAKVLNRALLNLRLNPDKALPDNLN